MKYLAVVSALLLFGCTKEPAPSTPYAKIQIKDGANEQILADVTGQWNHEHGELFLNAEGENGELFSVHLEHLTDTGAVEPISINNISYYDGFDFHPSSVSTGYLTIIECNKGTVDCSFSVTLHEQQYNTSLTIEGRFGVKNP